jgi:hypothetical protein
MKKGDASLFQFVIVFVVLIAFAAIFSFAILPKLKGTPKIAEGFFPEKCAATGLTKDDYHRVVSDAITQVPPDNQKVLQVRAEMKTCFPDAEVTVDQMSFISKSIVSIDYKKLDNGRADSLRKALDIYLGSNFVPLDNFPADALILFARGIYHGYGGSSGDLFKILDTVSKKKDATDQQKAEALALTGLAFEKNGNSDGAKTAFDSILSKYSATQDPEIALYAGIAYLRTGKAKESIPLLKAAAFSTSTSAYRSDFAGKYLAEADIAVGDTAAAESVLDAYMTGGEFAKSAAYDETFNAYAKVSQDKRTIKDCQKGVIAASKCICQGTAPLLLLPGNNNYCCAGGASAAAC